MKKRHAANPVPTLAAEAICVVFLGFVVAAANALQLFYILFPELGALASDVLLRPGGKWAKEPWKLVATPSLTAVIGILIGRQLPYGVVSIALTMAASIAVIYALRSAVVPAISAGVLPIVLGVTSWLYPLCICGDLVALTALLLVWRVTPFGRTLTPNRGSDRRATEVLERVPRPGDWMAAHFVFVVVLGIAAQFSGWRFILFPPLIVIAFEMLGHPETCPWAKAPFTFPVVCTLAAAAGVGADLWLGVTPFSAAIVLVVSISMLRVARLRMPPVLAIGLIPFVIAAPSYRYPLSVAIGTTSLTVWYLGYRSLSRTFAIRRAASRPASVDS